MIYDGVSDKRLPKNSKRVDLMKCSLHTGYLCVFWYVYGFWYQKTLNRLKVKTRSLITSWQLDNSFFKKQSKIVRTKLTSTLLSLSYKRTASTNQIPADHLVSTTRVHSCTSTVIYASVINTTLLIKKNTS